MDDASPILPSLYIGRVPGSQEEVESLKQQTGTTALLSLQTDSDLAGRGLSWPREVRWCRARGIEPHRLPIEDWSPQAVIDHMDEAVEILRRLLEEGHTVYLHCTAGVNRSPSVAMGYLVRVRGEPVGEALSVIRRARPQAEPYPEVLQFLRGPTVTR